MKKINELIDIIKSKPPIPDTEDSFRLRSSLAFRQTAFTNPFQYDLPLSLNEWWKKIEKAALFKDIDYKQWGLELLNDTESLEKTKLNRIRNSIDFSETDLIIGEFLGDLELVIISLDEIDFGQIIISLPIYPRHDWYFLKMDFLEFLEKYLDNEGNKFWVSNT